MQLPAERESTYILRSETVSTATKYTVSMLISENVIWKCLLSSTYWKENPIQRKILLYSGEKYMFTTNSKLTTSTCLMRLKLATRTAGSIVPITTP